MCFCYKNNCIRLKIFLKFVNVVYFMDFFFFNLLLLKNWMYMVINNVFSLVNGYFY